MPEKIGFVDIFETIEVGGDHVTVLRQILTPGDDGFGSWGEGPSRSQGGSGSGGGGRQS